MRNREPNFGLLLQDELERR